MGNVKTFKPRPPGATVDPDEALRIAAEVAPHHPPAEAAVPAPAPAPAPVSQPPPRSDPSLMLSMRFRESTLESLAYGARMRGVSQKQLVARALAEVGVVVAAADLEDRPTPRRRGGG